MINNAYSLTPLNLSKNDITFFVQVGKTPLMYTVEEGNVESVAMMIECKANIAAKDEVGTKMTDAQFVRRKSLWMRVLESIMLRKVWGFVGVEGNTCVHVGRIIGLPLLACLWHGISMILGGNDGAHVCGLAGRRFHSETIVESWNGHQRPKWGHSSYRDVCEHQYWYIMIVFAAPRHHTFL